METFGNRYQLVDSWKRIGNGWMARATDLTLKREVLVYRIRTDDEIPRQEAMRWLGKAARLSDVRFLHFLDAVSEEDSMYAVLTSESGGLLSDQLRYLNWTGQDILERIRDLASGIREARRERLLEFAVTAHNIWLDGEGRLRYINYWSEAKVDERSVRGLSLLLYQLCSRSTGVPDSIEEFCNALRPVLTDLPGGDVEQAIEWASTAFNASCTLGDYERGVNRLLTPQHNHIVPPAITVSRKEKNVEANRASELSSFQRAKQPAASSSVEKTKQPGESGSKPKPAATFTISKRSAAFHLRPWHWFTAAAGFLIVLLIWYAVRPHPTVADLGNKHSSAPLAAVAGVSPSPSAAQTPGNTAASPSPSASSASAKPAPTLSTKDAFVPNLVGHTREEAEKLVLEAGLRYQFFLESDEMSTGLVYKQDLIPGTPVTGGDRIAFWVSKGK